MVRCRGDLRLPQPVLLLPFFLSFSFLFFFTSAPTGSFHFGARRRINSSVVEAVRSVSGTTENPRRTFSFSFIFFIPSFLTTSSVVRV